ncbi:hypothetical protein M407DRAFT_25732 [Tulasnella calospora MUT 4182]|uniref:BTB domain-containing protein n=1 Tax=Tulasnella calospora MUT 4182 TaxID=1051891 RepID=A0A0C3LU36_9AGAM|nr:hypothetical protein M407DRAFT_25732 [Tulasnella calospora MUT 4182]
MASSTEIRVSTTFFPSALLPNVADGSRSDLIIHTSDTVFFYVHQSVLRARSNNNFGMLLSISTPQYTPNTTSPTHRNDHDQEPGTRDYFGGGQDNMPFVESSPPGQANTMSTIFVSEESVVLNIVLHLTYGMRCGRYGPSIEVISGALEALPRYGLPTPGLTNEIWTVLLRQAEMDPLRVYSLGAAHAIDSVCVQASEHTLKTPLSNVSEVDAMTMGPIYLRRLFFLHFGRVEALKRILGPPPDTHPDTAACSEVTQRAVKKAWKAALAELLLADKPQATSVASIVSAFGPIANSTQCLACKEKIQERIASVVHEWGNVKRSI